MLHPSYVELMKVVNQNEEGDEPVINSRYSIVCATAKRARQLIDGKDALVDAPEGEKPLSIAVDELYSGALQILPEDFDLDAVSASLEGDGEASDVLEDEES